MNKEFSVSNLQNMDFYINIIGLAINISILVTVIIYVLKNRRIVKLSHETALKLKINSEAAIQTIKLSEQILDETRAMRNLQSSPVITAFFMREKSNLFFVIQNIGNGIAKNLTYSFAPKLQGLRTEDVDRITDLGKSETLLPPNYQIKNEFGRLGSYVIDSENFSETLPYEFQVFINCKDALTNEVLSFEYKLNLRVSLGNCEQ